MTKHKQCRLSFLGVAAAALLSACSGGNDDRDRPPAISGLQDQSVPQDTVLGPLNFQVSDRDSDPAQITVMAQSSDKTLIPDEGITLAGSGSDRTIQLTPAAEAVGASTITVIAFDSTGLQATSTFRVQVNGVFVSFKGRVGEMYAKEPLIYPKRPCDESRAAQG
jgi:hypothetical protein